MMGNLSFIEKLKVLVDVSSSSGICIASIFILVFMGFMFLTTNRKNSKSTKLLFIGIYIVLLLVMLFQYNDSLADMFDYMMNNFFIVFYFPNLAIYLAAIIATNVILWVSIFNFKEDKLLKVINTVVYCIIHYLLILILNIVTSKKLDVFSQTSVYGNEKASALISLTSIIFIVWIIFIIIYKIIRSTQKKPEEVVTKYVEVPVKKVNPNIIEVSAPKTINGNITKKKPDVIPIEELQSKLIRQNNDEIKKYENMFTLEDYKLVLNILKNRKQNSSQSMDNTISIKTQEKNIREKIPTRTHYENRTKLDELLNI